MSRLGDKRHLIGATTLKLVNTFFASKEYVDQPKKIAKYATWAITDDGPGWYESPTPRGLISGVPGYTVSLFFRVFIPRAVFDLIYRNLRVYSAANSASLSWQHT